MGSITRVARNEWQKEIIKEFTTLEGTRNLHQVWSDFIIMAACAISNAVDAEHRQEREKTYMDLAAKYKPKELESMSKILADLVMAYEANSDQDLLGELYMALGLGNDRTGQFFTPYDVCRCMAELNWSDATAKISDHGFVSVNDPTVGAGALLIAFANTCRRHGVNYQQSVLFVAQDLDYVTACMCYIQLSLLGCPGYVYVGDTLMNPCTAIDDRGLLPRPSPNLWFTPLYFTGIWQTRCALAKLDLFFGLRSGPSLTGTEKNTEAPAEAKADLIDNNSEQDNNGFEESNNEIEFLTNENGQFMLF